MQTTTKPATTQTAALYECWIGQARRTGRTREDAYFAALSVAERYYGMFGVRRMPDPIIRKIR